MAMQIGKTKKPHGGKIKGAGAGTLGTGEPPQQPVSKYPLERGLPKVSRTDGAANTNYGRGQYAGPSSVQVSESHKLSDFDISPPDGDDAQDKLVNQGLAQSKSETAPAETGQERPISAEPFPTAHGMRNPNASPLKISADLDKTEGEPVRKPGT
jgi:hypothetical protein